MWESTLDLIDFRLNCTCHPGTLFGEGKDGTWIWVNEESEILDFYLSFGYADEIHNFYLPM